MTVSVNCMTVKCCFFIFFLQDYFFLLRSTLYKKKTDLADCLKKQSGNSLKTNNWLKNVRNIVDGLN